jgi:holo-[acyl-carrier protein] synthase
VVQNAWGRPEVVFSARADRLRRRLGIGAGHVTLTDEAGLVVAFAVLMKAPQRRARRPVRRTSVRQRPVSRRRSGA